MAKKVDMEKVVGVIADFLFWAIYPFLRLIYPIEIHWEDKMATRKALTQRCIVFSNHLGYVEGLYMTRLFHKYNLWTFVGKDWYEKPAINWLFRNLPYISVDRKGMDTEWLDTSAKMVEAGASIYILPEGHTSPIDQMDTFKPGFLVLAKKTNANLIPMYIDKKIKPFRLTRLVVGKPVICDLNEDGRPSLVLKKHAETCRSAVDNLGIQLKAGEL